MENEKKLDPKVLCHPNIPKPLHGLAPREIYGKEWWDKVRQQAYASTDYHCFACGVHKKDAKRYKWLEAHEYWDINYKTGICEVKDIVPLCHFCHNFIHSGRLYMITGKKKSLEESRAILEHGFRILRNNDLKCFPSTLHIANLLKAKTYNVKSYELPEEECEWKDYAVKINGQLWYSHFENYEEWEEFYDTK